MSGFANMTPEDREEYKSLLMDVDTNIDISSVILSDKNKQLIQEFIDEYKEKDTLYMYGLKPMNRLLFYGASGTGKTFLAKALSNKLNKTMLYVDISKSLTDSSAAKSVSDIFYLANKYKNCIIFLDECDSIAWSRDSKRSDGGDIRRVTNSIFQQLDQMDPDVIFISCTNMMKRLDPAFARRFDLKMEFRKPDKPIRYIAEKFLHSPFKLELDATQQDEQLVAKRSNLSYYEYQIIVERCMKKAILKNHTTDVKLSDVIRDIKIQIGTTHITDITEDDT